MLRNEIITRYSIKTTNGKKNYKWQEKYRRQNQE